MIATTPTQMAKQPFLAWPQGPFISTPCCFLKENLVLFCQFFLHFLDSSNDPSRNVGEPTRLGRPGIPFVGVLPPTPFAVAIFPQGPSPCVTSAYGQRFYL